jgi:hypothetical protein
MSQVIWKAVTPNLAVCRALGEVVHARFKTLPQASKFLKTLNQPAFIKQDLKNVKL